MTATVRTGKNKKMIWLAPSSSVGRKHHHLYYSQSLNLPFHVNLHLKLCPSTRSPLSSPVSGMYLRDRVWNRVYSHPFLCSGVTESAHSPSLSQSQSAKSMQLLSTSDLNNLKACYSHKINIRPHLGDCWGASESTPLANCRMKVCVEVFRVKNFPNLI